MSDEVWYVENQWECSSCHTMNPGREIACLACGNPKENSEKDQVEAKAPAVTDSALLELAQQDAHWTCEYCGGKQRAPNGNCANCGGKKPQELRPESSEFPGPSESGPPVSARRGSLVAPLPRARSRPPLLLLALLGLGAVAIIGLLVFLFAPREFEMEVARTQWTHTAHFQERLTRTKSDWGRPPNAFDVQCRRRQRGVTKCNPHDCNPHLEYYDCNPYECNCKNQCEDQGNGFSKCRKVCSTCYRKCSRRAYETCYDQCPVFADWCTYKYYEWVTQRSEVERGDDPTKMVWPRTPGGNETRRTVKEGTYVVTFRRSDGKTYEYAAKDSTDFRRFRTGDTWSTQISPVRGFTPLERLN